MLDKFNDRLDRIKNTLESDKGCEVQTKELLVYAHELFTENLEFALCDDMEYYIDMYTFFIGRVNEMLKEC